MGMTHRLVAAPSVIVGGTEVTPVVRLRAVSAGGPDGGVAYFSVRPAALEVRERDGRTSRVAIVDVSPWIRLAALIGAILLMIAGRRR